MGAHSPPVSEGWEPPEAIQQAAPGPERVVHFPEVTQWPGKDTVLCKRGLWNQGPTQLGVLDSPRSFVNLSFFICARQAPTSARLLGTDGGQLCAWHRGGQGPFRGPGFQVQRPLPSLLPIP